MVCIEKRIENCLILSCSLVLISSNLFAVEVKVELSLLDKEKEVDLMSPNGKASPFSECRHNGSLGHCSDEDTMTLRPHRKHIDYIEASVCHVKDLENGQ